MGLLYNVNDEILWSLTMMRKILYCAIIILFFTGSVWATSTGLNNIPTADVVPENVLVFQFISDVAHNNGPVYTTGFKYGPAKNI